MSKLTYTMFVSFIINTILSVIKIITGLVGRSISVIADGIHTFSDMSTDLISIAGDNLNKEKDKTLKRIINFVVGFIILGLGFASVYLAASKSLKTPSLWLLIIVPIMIILKYILSSYVLEKGILYNDTILIRNAHESDMDVISSLIVLLGLILIQLKDIISIFKYADMISALIVGLFIIKSGFDVISHEINDIMSKVYEDEEYKEKIYNLIHENPKVLNINNIEILKYGPYYELKVNIVLNENTSLKQANLIAHNIERKIKIHYPDMEYISIRVNNEICN